MVSALRTDEGQEQIQNFECNEFTAPIGAPRRPELNSGDVV